MWPVVCRGTNIGDRPGNSPTLGNSFIISTNVLLIHCFAKQWCGSEINCTDPDSSINTQKIKEKNPLISTVLYLLCELLSLKTKVNVPTESNKEKNIEKNLYFVGILKVTDKKKRDPDP